MIEYIKDNSGVFSNFLRVLDWMWYHKYSKVPIVINWFGYLDSVLKFKTNQMVDVDISLKTSKWVEQESSKLDKTALSSRRLSIPFYDSYSMRGCRGYFYTTPRIYFEKEFTILRREFKKLFDEFILFNDEFINSPKSNLVDGTKKVLGVHLRYSGHYCHGQHEGPIFSNNNFYQENANFIHKKFKEEGYDFLYIACDVEDFYDEIYKIIPMEKVLKLDYERISGDRDWSEKRDINFKNEVENVFHDFLNLSRTNHMVISVSNVCFGVLTFNPNLTYEFFPMLSELHGM